MGDENRGATWTQKIRPLSSIEEPFTTQDPIKKTIRMTYKKAASQTATALERNFSAEVAPLNE